MADRAIIIREEAFGAGFDVLVRPAEPAQQLDREFPDHKRAYGYASGLRMTHGWVIQDETGEAAR